ncbi:HAD family hydrolase [Candidatus Poribacteria bacterium]|nr:HAD family hydrolase [Candidatus Poribacteria bacterium]
MKDIRALIFDFGGTLDGNGVHWLERTYQFIHEQNPEITREAFDKADKATITEFAFGDSSIEWSYQDGSMLPIGAVASEYAARCTLRETANAIADGIYKRLGLSERMKNEYVDWFCAGAAEHLENNRRWLETLHGTYQLAVISNNFGNTRGWCDEYGLTPWLEAIIDSTVFGIAKPDARIFEAALSELGVAPAHAIYVGDSYAADMVGGKNAGLWTAWFVGNQVKTCPDPSMVDVQLSHLHELTDFLASP